MSIDLPERAGPAPTTTQPSSDDPFPHQQTDQNAPTELQEALFDRARRLPGITVGDSLISVPGARAFHLNAEVAEGPPEAFQRRTEFAHLHPAHDGSLHLTLPPAIYGAVLDAGWGVPHPVSGTMMVFGPRDTDELEVVWEILQASYRYATDSHTAGP